MDTQLQSNQPGESGNNQPSNTVPQASIQVDEPADESTSLTSARQLDSSHLLQSTEVQQPADMSASINDRQGGNQPSSTTPLQLLQALEQPPPTHTQVKLQYHHLDNSGNNQPSSTVTEVSIQADQPADDNSVLTSARQPDSSHLLQSAEVQQPADMSSSLNAHQDANQPSSTILLQSREDAQQPHDDMGSI